MRALLALLLFTPGLFAQQLVYPKQDPATFSVRKNLSYRTADGSSHSFDLYRPPSDQIVPVVVTCNVGIPGMKEWPGYVGWGEALASSGLASVQYDAIQNRGIESFDALMGELRARASEYRIDPSRVVLWGASANVQTALPLAMDSRREYVRGAVIYYGSADVSDIRTDLPVYFVRAGLDSPGLNASIDALLQRVLSANAPWTIENNGGGVHGFDLYNDNDVSREIIARTIAFIRRAASSELTNAYASVAEDARVGAAFARGDWPAAIAGYRDRVSAQPENANWHLRLGLALYNSGQPAEALPELERAWQLGRRGTRDTVVPAARAAAKAGNEASAIHWLTVALSTPFATLDDIRADDTFAELRKSPSFAELESTIETRGRVVALFKGGSGAEAMKILKAAGVAGVGSEALLESIGNELLAGGLTKQSVEVFGLETRRYPRSAVAWENYSEALEGLGDMSGAVRAAKRSLELRPEERVRKSAEERVRRLVASDS